MPTLLTSLLDSLSDITVIQFVQKMVKLNAHNDALNIPTVKNGETCKVWELNYEIFGTTCAKQIPCLFYGGPPTKHTIYTGTLLTMLIDRILTKSYSLNNFGNILDN